LPRPAREHQRGPLAGHSGALRLETARAHSPSRSLPRSATETAAAATRQPPAHGGSIEHSGRRPTPGGSNVARKARSRKAAPTFGAFSPFALPVCLADRFRDARVLHRAQATMAPETCSIRCASNPGASDTEPDLPRHRPATRTPRVGRFPCEIFSCQETCTSFTSILRKLLLRYFGAAGTSRFGDPSSPRSRAASRATAVGSRTNRRPT
jgi:hypothetical protein